MHQKHCISHTALHDSHKEESHPSPALKHSPLSPCPHVSLLASQMRLACHFEEENLFQKAFRGQVWDSLACFCDPWHSLVLQGALFTVIQLENTCHLSCIHPIFLSVSIWLCCLANIKKYPMFPPHSKCNAKCSWHGSFRRALYLRLKAKTNESKDGGDGELPATYKKQRCWTLNGQ